MRKHFQTRRITAAVAHVIHSFCGEKEMKKKEREKKESPFFLFLFPFFFPLPPFKSNQNFLHAHLPPCSTNNVPTPFVNSPSFEPYQQAGSLIQSRKSPQSPLCSINLSLRFLSPSLTPPLQRSPLLLLPFPFPSLWHFIERVAFVELFLFFFFSFSFFFFFLSFFSLSAIR